MQSQSRGYFAELVHWFITSPRTTKHLSWYVGSVVIVLMLYSLTPWALARLAGVSVTTIPVGASLAITFLAMVLLYQLLKVGIYLASVVSVAMMIVALGYDAMIALGWSSEAAAMVSLITAIGSLFIFFTALYSAEKN